MRLPDKRDVRGVHATDLPYHTNAYIERHDTLVVGSSIRDVADPITQKVVQFVANQKKTFNFTAEMSCSHTSHNPVS